MQTKKSYFKLEIHVPIWSILLTTWHLMFLTVNKLRNRVLLRRSKENIPNWNHKEPSIVISLTRDFVNFTKLYWEHAKRIWTIFKFWPYLVQNYQNRARSRGLTPHAPMRWTVLTRRILKKISDSWSMIPVEHSNGQIL